MFGENGSLISGMHDQSNVETEQLMDKPYVKLDLKRSVNHGAKGDRFNQPSLLINRQYKGDSLPSLTFQFNTGEVIVTSAKNAADQEGFSTARRGFYPKWEPIKSRSQNSPSTPTRKSNTSPLMELRENVQVTQKSFYENRTDSTITMTPDFRFLADMPPLPRSRGLTPKTNSEIWTHSGDGSVWHHKPEKIDETDEEFATPQSEIGQKVEANVLIFARRKQDYKERATE